MLGKSCGSLVESPKVNQGPDSVEGSVTYKEKVSSGALALHAEGCQAESNKVLSWKVLRNNRNSGELLPIGQSSQDRADGSVLCRKHLATFQ